ncbi:MAG: hypothetical protein GXN91_00830, partial [Epsilonproteobacteria bacterium]|nr:hypothetical protein [Campylobacterota bacterium]
IASGLIYAGGDIAPVEPVQEPVVPAAAPAACDFWGSIGFRYDFNDDDTDDTEFGDAENNRFLGTVVLGGEKEIGYGFGIGAELAGSFLTDGEFDKIPGVDRENAEISQLYATYKYGNTAIKAGRQELPKAVSPWAWSDRTVGRIDRAYNGVTVVNTDLADTTLVGAWIRSYVDRDDDIKIGDKGLFMLGAINKSLANTTLSGAAYYIPDFQPDVDASSVWAAAETKFNNFDLGLQAAYADVDADGLDSTFGVAGYVGTNYNGLDAKLTLAYINDGDAPLNLGGTSGFWGNVGYATYGIDNILGNGSLGGDTVGEKQTIAKLDLGYTLPNNYGRIYGGAAYIQYDEDMYDKAVAGRVGYSFNLKGMDARIEYRYTKLDEMNGDEEKHQKVRLEGIYKF